jgi:hypothetical protein
MLTYHILIEHFRRLFGHTNLDVLYPIPGWFMILAADEMFVIVDTYNDSELNNLCLVAIFSYELYRKSCKSRPKNVDSMITKTIRKKIRGILHKDDLSYNASIFMLRKDFDSSHRNYCTIAGSIILEAYKFSDDFLRGRAL